VSKAEIQTGLSDALGWDTWIILIPPEFTVPGALTLDPSQIVSTLTNNYAGVLVAKLGPDDRYAPNWTMVAIEADANCNVSGPLTATACGTPAGQTYYNHQYINFTTAGEWYYAR